MPKAFSIALGLAIILGFFAGVVWLTCRCVKRSEDPARLIFKIIITLGVIGFLVFIVLKSSGDGAAGKGATLGMVMACAFVLGLYWAPNIAAIVAKPLTSLFDGGETEPVPEASYSIAMAKRKASHPREAVELIKSELQKFPTDVTGQLMLAEIQAEDLHDLQAADLTIQRFCNQPGHTPANIALALNQLADHYLKVGRDTEGARQALEKIVETLPDTPQAQQAEQRLAHLAGHEEFQEAREQKIQLVEGAQNVGLMKDSSTLRKAEADPAELAAKYVKHLQEHPLDNEAREKLAVLYAEHYQRFDLAIKELESLIAFPNQSAKDIVHWHNLIADIQVQRGDDYETIKKTLERIIDLYPARSFAENARQRIEHLRLQIKGKEQEKRIALGVYEQNIGLKKPRPPMNPGQDRDQS